MGITFKTFILFGSVILTGLSAGFFYAWSVSVIPGTLTVSNLSYLETMQSINRAILNPYFYLVFFGSIVFLSLSSIYEFHQNKFAFWLLLIAAISYMVGTIGVTGLGNVPLNEKLEILEIPAMSHLKMEEFRAFYESNWNRLHWIRTGFSIFSFALVVSATFIHLKSSIKNELSTINTHQMKKNIVVIGGTGKTGSRVVKGLEKLGHHVQAVGRKTNPAFDWSNPESYAKALQNMDRAYIVYYPDLAVPGAKEAIKNLTEAALAAGLEKVVLLSGKGETEAEACEAIVANSGLDYTLVRASWFNQNFSEGAFLQFILNGTVALPMPEAEIPFVDTNDVADVVTKVLIDDSYNGQTITVTGPNKRTFKEVVDIMAEASGKDLKYIPISIEEFKEGMRQAGLPDDYVWLFGYLFKEVLGNPDNQVVSNDVELVLGRKAIDFTEFAKKTAASGVWR